jgi:hypothetical protein
VEAFADAMVYLGVQAGQYTVNCVRKNVDALVEDGWEPYTTVAA